MELRRTFSLWRGSAALKPQVLAGVSGVLSADAAGAGGTARGGAGCRWPQTTHATKWPRRSTSGAAMVGRCCRSHSSSSGAKRRLLLDAELPMSTHSGG